VGGSSEKHHYKDGEKIRIRIYNLHNFPIQFIVYQKSLQGPYERVSAQGVKLAGASNNLFGAKGKLLAPNLDVFLKDCKIYDNTEIYTNEYIIEIWPESRENALIQFSRTAIIYRDQFDFREDKYDSELSPKSPLSIKEETSPINIYSYTESPKASSPSCKFLIKPRKAIPEQPFVKYKIPDTPSTREDSEKYTTTMTQLRDDYSEVLISLGLDAEEVLQLEVKKHRGDLKECSNIISNLINTKVDAMKSKTS